MYRIKLFTFLILSSIVSIESISTSTYKCDPHHVCGCSTASTTVSTRIIGGEVAPNRAWGWMASLQRTYGHICGAILLTPEYAVTAAHCVTDPLYQNSLSIFAGSNYLYDDKAQKRRVINITVHPDYDSNTVINDIAIIRFPPLDVSSNTNITFICLPQQGEDPFKTGTNLVAIGWGVTVPGSLLSSSYLRQVRLEAFSSNSTDCVDSNIRNASTQLCAGVPQGGRGKILTFFVFSIHSVLFLLDTCQGDSGGPLMAFNHTWILAGITSNGDGCATAGQLGVYTRVSAYITFLTTNINTLTLTKITGVHTVIGVSTSQLQNNQSYLSQSHGNKVYGQTIIAIFWPLILVCFLTF